MSLSTRIRFAPLISLCIAIFLAAGAALADDPSSRSPSVESLPAGALKDSSSAYLRDASAGPVRWQPWTDATFAMARRLHRPVLIDIGAVWCHWCHVMDETTYSNSEVAALLNGKYVPIKVDTDQRPDVDSIYQNAAAHLTGAGGWPLTCFATPDGGLLYATGYLPAQPRPRESPTSAMIPILQRIAEAYAKDPAGVEREANAIAKKMATQPEAARNASGDEKTLRREILASLASSYDSESGGFGRGSGPRFYDFPAIRLALAYGFFQHDSFRRMATESLDKMSRGGVFDQLGGGFHRYSTDQGWRVPHFEKMGYDQAMALRTYSDAYEVTHDPSVLETMAGIERYVNGTLLDPATHAFFADQDADSFKGDDGSYYTWTVAEVKKLLPAKVARATTTYYGMTDTPALAPDGRIVLQRPLTDQNSAAEGHRRHAKARQKERARCLRSAKNDPRLQSTARS